MSRMGIKTIMPTGGKRRSPHRVTRVPVLSIRWLREVERDMLPLDRMGMAEGIYFAGATGATISRSSTSNTNVAPGLIVGGAPLSPYARVEGQTNLFLLPTFIC